MTVAGCTFRTRDAIVLGRCTRCGVPGGQHVTPEGCIDALRDWIAELQFRAEKKAKPNKNSRGFSLKRRPKNALMTPTGSGLQFADYRIFASK